MKYFFFTAVILSFNAFAAELPMTNYVKMQEALAGDNLAGATALHKLMCEKELKSFNGQYKDCSKSFKTIDELRNSFKQVSILYMKNGSKSEMNKLEKVHCPMAGASWLQKPGKIANPYYGKSMLECGEKQKL